jgi:hypothetical protein
MTWTDDPIARADEDELGRGPFAAQTGSLIDRSHSVDASLVYGLVGSWGSGKTSLINMIVEQLQAGNSRWRTTWFTPWSAADETSIMTEFFQSLSSVLPEEKTGTRDRIRKYARMLAPALKAIPYAGDAASEVASEFLDAQLASPPWQERFQSLSDDLAKMQLSILVIVDDLDRLDHEELVNVFRTIRLLGRFPGVDYLLAYDQESALAILQSGNQRDETTALRYLEKIVQFPLSIPPVESFFLDKIFQSALAEISSSAFDTWDEQDRFRLTEAYNNSLAPRLNTLRAMHRYVAQLSQYRPLLAAGETNTVDYALITFCRLHYPRLYSALPAVRGRLMGQGFFSPWEKPTDAMRSKAASEWCQSFIGDHVRKEETAPAQYLLKALFPALGGELIADRVRRGVSDPDYFPRYFAFGLPADDISDVLISERVVDAARGERDAIDWFREQLSQEEPGRLERILSKAVEASTVLDANDSRSLLRQLPHIYLSSRGTASFMFNPQHKLQEWMASLAASSEISGDELLRVVDQFQPRQRIRMLQRVASIHRTTNNVEKERDLLTTAGSLSSDQVVSLLTAQDWRNADSIRFFYAIARSNADADVRDPIWDLIDNAHLRLVDIAALSVMVNDDHFVDGRMTMTGFDGQMFGDFCDFRGIGRDDTLSTEDLPSDFDVADLTWENKVRYASRYAKLWTAYGRDRP